MLGGCTTAGADTCCTLHAAICSRPSDEQKLKVKVGPGASTISPGPDAAGAQATTQRRRLANTHSTNTASVVEVQNVSPAGGFATNNDSVSARVYIIDDVLLPVV